MVQLSPEHIASFQTKILTWYADHERDLPWRKTSNPYAILVSEIMSQQTQITRVVPKYTAWMEAFPTIKALATASTADVLSYWSGLGYNRRALFLQKAAKAVSEQNGQWPRTVETLVSLPGIGKYTASAVACFAFHAQIPVIDTNIRKVITVEFCDGSMPSEKELEAIAWEILPKGKAKIWNQALMDYASAELKHEKIPVTKQSKFIGSNRWYRGDLLKILTREQSITRNQLAAKWKKDITTTDKEWFEAIIAGLEKEGFVIVLGQSIHIAI